MHRLAQSTCIQAGRGGGLKIVDHSGGPEKWGGGGGVYINCMYIYIYNAQMHHGGVSFGRP